MECKSGELELHSNSIGTTQQVSGLHKNIQNAERMQLREFSLSAVFAWTTNVQRQRIREVKNYEKKNQKRAAELSHFDDCI